MTAFDNRTHPLLRVAPYSALNLGITTRCSMKCPNCSVAVPRFAAERRAFNAGYKTIQQDAQHLQGLEYVRLTGGEPTAHPHFPVIARNARDWFAPKYLFLETNGARFFRHHAVIERVFDLVFVTHYEQDAVYPGSPDNTHVVEFAAKRLGDRLIREPPVRHDRGHTPLLQLGGVSAPCSKWNDTGLPMGWYNGLLYPCCVTVGIDESKGIPVTADWRDRIKEIDLGCSHCCYGGT